MTVLFRALLDQAETGRLITVNERLARRLRAEYDHRMASAGRKVWQPAAIQSAEQWLRSLAERLLPDLVFPSPVQDQLLWETVIKQAISAAERSLVQVPATARRAREAHTLLHQHGISFPPQQGTPDQQAFLGWRQAYLDQLAERGYADPGARLRLLAAAVPEGFPVDEPLLLTGFDEVKPDLRCLLDRLAETGVEVRIQQDGATCERPGEVLLATDPEQEVRAAAAWSRRLLEEGIERIGIVVPELPRYRSWFLTAFAAELEPKSALRPTEGFRPFSMSLGSPLGSEGVIAVALLLMNLEEEWSLDELSRLLRTPYLVADRRQERFRSDLELRLRRQRRKDWTCAQVLKQIRPAERNHEGRRLRRTFESLGAWVADRRQRAPSEWSEALVSLLSKVGWPGERSLDSREYQALEKFHSQLQQFSSFDAILGRLDRRTAGAVLRRLCLDEPFQPESPDCKVEVVGMLEAGGLQFEHLWVMGLNDGLLPGPLRPNPFLPLGLQRAHRLPHADPEHEVEYSRTLLNNLFSAAPQVVVSCPRFDGDSPVRLHRAVRDWPVREVSPFESHDPMALITAGEVELETFADHQAPPLNSRKVVSGGTTLLKDQALCPFRAFAHHRLRATAPESADIGLDAMMRGGLVHHLLEHFWRGCRDWATLVGLGDGELTRRVDEAAGKALATFERSSERDLPPRLRMLEKERLEKLGREWLEIEARREEFTVLVDRLEQALVADFGPLQIRTRIDRVDRLGPDRLAVIDYKTGQPDPAQWLEERMTDPQLPIYASACAAEGLGAVLLAVVRAGECRFRGLCDDESKVPGLPEQRMSRLMKENSLDDLAQVVEDWRGSLQGLARQFASGWAAVDPVDEQRACRFCDLTSLCRIRDARSEWPAGEGGAVD